MITIGIDPKEQARFNGVIRQYLELNHRDMAMLCNNKALQVAARSSKATRKVTKGQIEYELGQTGTTPGLTPTGRISKSKKKAVRVLTPDSLAERLVKSALAGTLNDRHMSQKLKAKIVEIAKTKGVEAAARSLIGQRVKSRAFLASGWRPAIQNLARIADDTKIKSEARADAKDAPKYGVPKGRSIAAKPGAKCAATIANSATKGSTGAAEFVKSGLIQAMREVANDMMAYTIPRMNKTKRRVLGGT